MSTDQPYTPSPDEAQMFYEAGRAAMRRAATGEQIVDIAPYTAEWLRMIEAVRAEERADLQRTIDDLGEELRIARDGRDTFLEERNNWREMWTRLNAEVNDRITKARAEEREKAAQIAENIYAPVPSATAQDIADRIRARGKEQSCDR